jgi:hypothetical protein
MQELFMPERVFVESRILNVEVRADGTNFSFVQDGIEIRKEALQNKLLMISVIPAEINDSRFIVGSLAYFRISPEVRFPEYFFDFHPIVTSEDRFLLNPALYNGLQFIILD